MNNQEILFKIIGHYPDVADSNKKKQFISGKDYIAYVNTLRDNAGLIKSIEDRFIGVTVEQAWVEVTGKSCTSSGCIATDISYYDEEPVIGRTLAHIVIFVSSNVSLLNLVRSTIKKFQEEAGQLEKTLSGKKKAEKKKSEKNFVTLVAEKVMKLLVSTFQ